MSHEFESGVFVKQPAWHGLGNVVPEGIKTPQELMSLSGLDWKVDVCPLMAVLPSEETSKTSFYGVVRNTDNRCFGVVKSRWTPYQNWQAISWSIPLIESGQFTWETAGSLKGGESCWILLKSRQVEIVNDPLTQYLMVNWNHNGKTSNCVKPTSIRVVCNNTLTQALSQISSARHLVRHSSLVELNMDNVRTIFSESMESFECQRLEFERLAKKQVSKERVGTLLEDLFPVIDDEKENKGKTIALKNREIAKHYIENGSGIEENGLLGTAYGVYSGISEAVEHVIGGDRVKDRGNNILNGKGKNLLDRAFELLAA